MHDNGTAKQADDRISTPGIIQAVRGNSDVPARACGLPENSPQRPTAQAMDAPARPQPVPTSARCPAKIRGRANAEVDPQARGVTPDKSTSDEIAKLSIDVKQTSR